MSIDGSPDLPPIAHVGYIVEDLAAGIDAFRRALGATSFRVYDYVPLRAWADGQPLSPCRLRIGFGGAGLHHVACSTARYEEWRARFLFEAEAEDAVNGYRRSFYAEAPGMAGIVEISEIARHREEEGT